LDVAYPHFVRELVNMASHDLDVRARLAENGELFDGYNAEMREVHRRNGDRLAKSSTSWVRGLVAPPSEMRERKRPFSLRNMTLRART